MDVSRICNAKKIDDILNEGRVTYQKVSVESLQEWMSCRLVSSNIPKEDETSCDIAPQVVGAEVLVDLPERRLVPQETTSDSFSFHGFQRS